MVDEREAERQVRPRARSASVLRSAPRQPRPGEGSATLPTSGKIVRERRIYDFTGLLMQVGVLKGKPAVKGTDGTGS